MEMNNTYINEQIALYGKVVSARLSQADHHWMLVTYENGVKDVLVSSLNQWPVTCWRVNSDMPGGWERNMRAAMRKAFPGAKVR